MLLSVSASVGTASEVPRERLLSELASIETLLILSETISAELETRLAERETQLENLRQSLSELERTNSEQSIELKSLRSELGEHLRELIVLRRDLENSQRRSSIYRTLLERLETEHAETLSSLTSSEATSATLSKHFDEYERTSKAALRRARWTAAAGWIVAAAIAAIALF